MHTTTKHLTEIGLGHHAWGHPRESCLGYTHEGPGSGIGTTQCEDVPGCTTQISHVVMLCDIQRFAGLGLGVVVPNVFRTR